MAYPSNLTDQDLMSEYVRTTMTVFAFTDWLASEHVEEVPEKEHRVAQGAVAEWREVHAGLYAECQKRGIL